MRADRPAVSSRRVRAELRGSAAIVTTATAIPWNPIPAGFVPATSEEA